MLYHIIGRGNQRQDVFLDDQDFRAYLHRIEKTHAILPFRLYAYALMRNHLHLLVEVGGVPISRIMQTLQQRYTQHYNAKYKKIGHVFHGRFKAIICQRDEYLLELVRYIHLNPVRAGIVKQPGDYPWTGHNSYLASKAPSWLDRDAILMQFSKNREKAKARYEDFVMRGVGQGHREDLYAVKEQQVLGNDDFVGTLPLGTSAGEKQAGSTSISQIATAVAAVIGIDQKALMTKGKERRLNDGRGLVALLAVERGHLLKDVALYFQRSTASLSHKTTQTRRDIRTNEVLARLKTEVEKRLS